MPKELDLSNIERQFIIDSLVSGQRLDGRELDAFRSLELEFGEEYGLADVRLGKTRVIARVSASVVQPFPDRPFDGLFTITTELGPMASPQFEVGRQTELEPLLARLIEKSIRRSNALDTESLCIVAGQKCWQIRADVHFINHDGGLVDAACIAVIAALQHFRRPDVSVQGEVVTIHDIRERVPVPLSILHVPICVTFSYYDIAKSRGVGTTATAGAGDEEDHGEDVITVVDANLAEENLRDGEMTVTLNKFGEVCQISKAGGVPVDALALHRDINLALVKVREITEFMARRLKEEEERRVRRDNLLESKAENEREF